MRLIVRNICPVKTNSSLLLLEPKLMKIILIVPYSREVLRGPVFMDDHLYNCEISSIVQYIMGMSACVHEN